MKIETKNYPKVKDLVIALDLTVLVDEGMEKIIQTKGVYRAGYELSGFFPPGEETTTNINILGRKELVYLGRMDKEERERILKKYLSCRFPVLVLTYQNEVVVELLKIAKKYKKAVLLSKIRTLEFLRKTKFYLQKALADEIILNDYILLDVYGVGILLTGYKDAKLGATVELLERGHKFISNTNLRIKNVANRFLMGLAETPEYGERNRFVISGQNGSKIDVTTNFGIKAVRADKKISLAIELEKWDEKKFYDRLGLEERYQDFLGLNIPKIVLPVRKGRNLAVIIETAAINYRLKESGVNSAEYFLNESQRLIKENKERGKNVNSKNSIPVRNLKERFDLKVLNGEEWLDKRFITTTGVYRPSLALTGYFEIYEEDSYKGVQLFTENEFKYLETLPEDERERNLSRYFEENFPAIVVSGVKKIPDYFIKKIVEKDRILLKTDIKRCGHVIAVFSAYLENCFAMTTTIHGVLVELYGFGVLLTGKSGIGKSETALELIQRGHRLIADDAVRFERGVVGDITGFASKLPYFMEIRGLGIIDIKTLYGMSSVRMSKKLDIIIELQEFKDEENSLTSMDYKSTKYIILGEEIPKVKLYISSGRNAAAMVEIAVMNLMSKVMDYEFEKIYLKKLKNSLGEKDEEKKN